MTRRIRKCHIGHLEPSPSPQLSISRSLYLCMLLVCVAAAVGTLESYTTAHAQNMASQESITVNLGAESHLDIHVRHVLSPSNEQTILNLVGPDVSNITISAGTLDSEQLLYQNVQTNTSDDDGSKTILVPPTDDEIIAVEYVIQNALDLTGMIYSINYDYPHTTTFYTPDNTDVVLVNDRVINLEEKSGFACHGCYMKLEYSVDTSKHVQEIKINDHTSFTTEIISHTNTNLEFDLATGDISFQIHGDESDNIDSQFITVVIPADLMNPPFTILHDGAQTSHKRFENGTHSHIIIKLESSGTYTINGMLSQFVTEQQILSSSKDTSWYYYTVVLVVAFVSIIGIFVAKKIISTRHRRHTYKNQTRQFDSGTLGTLLHTRLPMVPFQTI